MKTIIFSFMMITSVYLLAQSKYLPENQNVEGGQLSVIHLPENIELYTNVKQQKLLFLVDYDYGGMNTVELRKGNTVKSSKNIDELIKCLKRWKTTQLKINGEIISEWGVYYDIYLIYINGSDAGKIIVYEGDNKLFEGTLPGIKKRKLTDMELKEWGEK